MKILFITDVHYKEEGGTNYPHIGASDYINSFGPVLKEKAAELRSLAEDFDLLVNLGDLIQDKDLETDIRSYREAIELISGTTPVKHVVGNHDIRYLSREQLAVCIGEKQIYYSFDLNGYHHTVLDANRRTMPGPFHVPDEQLAWLQEDLSQTNLETLVYCHYPLDNQSLLGNYYFKKENPSNGFPDNKENIRTILEQSGKVKYVFNGHTHFYHQETINGITYTTVPSFTENNGSGEPTLEYLAAELDRQNYAVEVGSFRA
jgi:3',5'-cyclic-AMP phosphodiesterase